MTLILTIISGLIGIVGTVLMYRLNPRQKIWDELDRLSRVKIELERRRDEALKIHDNDSLTIAGNELIKLQNDQTSLLQRLRDINIK